MFFNFPTNSSLESQHCGYRITRETIQDDIPAEDIPFEGICSVSWNRKEICEYPGYATETCLLRKREDFCEMPWAINPEDWDS